MAYRRLSSHTSKHKTTTGIVLLPINSRGNLLSRDCVRRLARVRDLTKKHKTEAEISRLRWVCVFGYGRLASPRTAKSSSAIFCQPPEIRGGGVHRKKRWDKLWVRRDRQIILLLSCHISFQKGRDLFWIKVRLTDPLVSIFFSLWGEMSSVVRNHRMKNRKKCSKGRVALAKPTT